MCTHIYPTLTTTQEQQSGSTNGDKVEATAPMRQLLTTFVFVTILSLLVPATAFAQGGSPEVGNVEIANIFSWLTSDPINWTRGVLFAVLGFVGALVIMYTMVGGALPGVAGQARIDHDTEQLNRHVSRLEELVAREPLDSQAIDAVGKVVDQLRDDLSSERRYLYLVAAPLYVVLGAFFASALAQDMLQALAIGAGWTAFIGTFGLKSDYKQRKEIKDEALDHLLAKVDDLASGKTTLSTAEAEKSQILLESLNGRSPGDVGRLKGNAAVARAL